MYTQKKKGLDFDMDTNINLISQVFSHSSTRKESL
jgi:hypothetical protein